MRQRLLLTSLTLLFSFSASGFTCYKEGQIKTLSDKKETIKKSHYCINDTKFETISFDCIKNNSCQALSSYEKGEYRKSDLGSRYGSPYYKKCYNVGGTGEMVFIQDENKKWKQTGLCNFSDGSFISVFNKVKQKN